MVMLGLSYHNIQMIYYIYLLDYFPHRKDFMIPLWALSNAFGSVCSFGISRVIYNHYSLQYCIIMALYVGFTTLFFCFSNSILGKRENASITSM